MNAEESEVGVLDLLLVIAENLRVLVFGPILVGVLAWVVMYLMPQSYTSEAILALPSTTTTTTTSASASQAAAIMVSPLVLDPVIELLHLAEGRSVQVARAGLLGQIKAAVGRDGLLRLDVTAQTPANAQVLAVTVVDVWLKSTVPGDQARADLEKRLSYAQKSLDAVSRLLTHLDSGGGAELNNPLTRGNADTSLVGLGELQARYLAEVLSIPRELRGLSRDVVKQPPTLPTEASSPKKDLIAMMAAIAAGILLLLGIFVKQAWKSNSQDPQTAEKQRRLVEALGIRRNTSV